MYNIKVKDILEATQGKLLGGDIETVIGDVCINSREIKENDLFVPIIGENVDAHRFINDALKVGAATLTSNPDEEVKTDKAYILVEDTIKALQSIGIMCRKRLDIPIIGVTGSVGKTTTREMIKTALSGTMNVYETEKNFNSQIGVPIVLSRIDEDKEIAVLEMGMSEPGQMENLSRIVQPDICVVTVIGVAHIEFLKTKENIRKEKLAITSHMNKDGVLFINGDDEMLLEIKNQIGVKTFCYGTNDACEYKAENIRVVGYNTVYDYVHEDKKITVTLNSMGKHNVLNSLAGMAIADYLGKDLEATANTFKSFNGMRLKFIDVPGKYTIIDDTYNASPDSMKASINVLSDMEVKGRRIAVLGDMKELGENSEQYHRELGEYVASKADMVVTVGELAKYIADSAKIINTNISCYSFDDIGEATLFLLNELKADDVVLLKASNSMKFNTIVEHINL